MIINAQNKPLIFPKLTMQMIEEGKIVLAGKRKSDFQMLALLQDQTSVEECPHVMIMDKGNWRTVDNENDEPLDIKFDACSIRYHYNALKAASLIRQLCFLNVAGSASVIPNELGGK